MQVDGAGQWVLPQSVAELRSITLSQWQQVLSAGRVVQGRWLQAAARLGDAQAQTCYGQWCQDSALLSERNSAFFWFRLAADQQHPMALNMLGRCHELGIGTAGNAELAAMCYEAAATAGLDWGMYNFANMLATGRGVAPDQPRAFSLYLQAARMKHAKSMNLAGRYYEEGVVVPRDMTLAVAWYRQSAELGDFRRCYSYATVLAERGQYNEAAGWLRQIPAQATAAFLQKIVAELRCSDNALLRSVAEELAESVREAEQLCC